MRGVSTLNNTGVNINNLIFYYMNDGQVFVNRRLTIKKQTKLYRYLVEIRLDGGIKKCQIEDIGTRKWRQNPLRK